MDGPAQSHTDTCRYSINVRSQSPESLSALAAQVTTCALSLSRSYIWHHSPGGLSLSPAQPTPNQPAHLEGKTDVTDAVDDEWLIVWLLVEITKRWTDAVVSVWDEDGEFLLIEGAEQLPRWLTPDNAQNRVWLYQGHLHLVPLEHISTLPFPSTESSSPSFNPDDDAFLDRQSAISLVRNDSINTRAEQQLEDVIFERVNVYPKKMEEHLHRTLAYLPEEVALALASEPALAAEAIKAFYEREPGTLKSCNVMKRFPPSAPSDATSPSSTTPSTVLVPTTLTRPLYSQLVLQRFFPPKPFDKARWMDRASTEEEKRRRSVGMKLACGFEMLYQLTAPQPRLNPGQKLDPSSEPGYQVYLKGLQDAGFFEGEVQGSRKWAERMELAVAGWDKAKAKRTTPSFAQRVDEAITLSRSSPGALANRVQGHLTADALAQLESGEEWLALDEQGLEEMLQSRGPGKGGLGNLDSDFSDSDDDEEEQGDRFTQERREERKAQRMAKQLEGMAGKVQEFVDGRGAVDGAQFSDEQSDEDEDEDEDEMAIPAMTAEERAIRTAALVAPLAAADWGHKPTPAKAPALPLNCPPREPKLTRNAYDGASDDSSDEEEEDDSVPPSEKKRAEYEGAEQEDEEDEPAVVGEPDLDLEEEMDEFLKFATQTLGLSEEQYSKILGERQQRGAFVPGPAKPKKINVVPKQGAEEEEDDNVGDIPPVNRAPPPVPQQLRNPNLSDFDALMSKMEAELARSKPSTSRVPPTTSAKKSAPPSKPAAKKAPVADNMVLDSDSEEEDEDMAAMDDELASLFTQISGQEAERGEGGQMDLNLVKNFLESFQSQGGFAGPAGNLAGRMGYNLPRDAMEQ